PPLARLDPDHARGSGGRRLPALDLAEEPLFSGGAAVRPRPHLLDPGRMPAHRPAAGLGFPARAAEFPVLDGPARAHAAPLSPRSCGKRLTGGAGCARLLRART